MYHFSLVSKACGVDAYHYCKSYRVLLLKWEQWTSFGKLKTSLLRCAYLDSFRVAIYTNFALISHITGYFANVPHFYNPLLSFCQPGYISATPMSYFSLITYKVVDSWIMLQCFLLPLGPWVSLPTSVILRSDSNSFSDVCCSQKSYNFKSRWGLWPRGKFRSVRDSWVVQMTLLLIS